MGEPLSIAASIAGLVSLAGSIIRITYRYGDAVHHAEAEIRSLGHEAAALYGVLCSVQFVARQLEDEGAGLQATRFEHIRGCFAALENINNVLVKHAPPVDEKKTAEKWKRKLLYPFSNSEVKEWTGELERWKSLITLAISSDSILQLQELLSSQHTIAEDVRELRLILQREEDAKIERKMNDHLERLLLSFDVDARRNIYDRSCSIRCPGTGNWLLQDDASYQDWLEHPQSILWLKGIVGSGKTILVSAMVTEFQNARDVDTGVAYFFCTYADAASQNPQRILAALAKQLAEQNEQAFEELLLFFDIFRPSIGRHEFLPIKLLEELLLHICDAFPKIQIVVDGIEECDKSALDLLDCLCTIKESCKSQVALAISSRSEEQFKPRIGEHVSITIAATNSDLRLYVWTEVTERSRKGLLRISDDIRDEVCEKLVEKANGMFQWVACQIDYLCELQTVKEHREALDFLPLTLKAAYERLLQKLIENKPISVRTRIRRTFAFVNWSCALQHLRQFDYSNEEVIQGPYIPLPGPAICEAVSIDDGQEALNFDAVPSEEDLLHCCGSLVRRSNIGHGDLEFSHFTVKEYLAQLGSHHDTELAAYAVTNDPKQAYAELVEFSLKYLQLDDFTNDRPAETLSDISLEPEYRSRDFKGDPFNFRETAVRSIWQTIGAFSNLAEESNQITLLTFHLLEGDAFQSFAQYTLLLYRFSLTRQHEYRRGKVIVNDWSGIIRTPACFATMLRSPLICEGLCARGNGFDQHQDIKIHMGCATWGRLKMPDLTMFVAGDSLDLEGDKLYSPPEGRANMIGWTLDFAIPDARWMENVTNCLWDVSQTGDLESLAVILENSRLGATRNIVDEALRCLHVSNRRDVGSPEHHLFALRNVCTALVKTHADGHAADAELMSRLRVVQEWLASPDAKSQFRKVIDDYVNHHLAEHGIDMEGSATGDASEPGPLLLKT